MRRVLRRLGDGGLEGVQALGSSIQGSVLVAGAASERRNIKAFAAGALAGIGAALVVDKIWWLYFADKFDFVGDHYLTGAILLAIGLIAYLKLKK